MNKRVLIVDDEPHVLESLRRGLGKRYEIVTAGGADEGLRTMASQGPFAVIIADLAMPGMDGVKYLSKSKEVSPGSVRMLLTGHGDFDTAVSAVNEGGIFRFLTKPCPLETIIRAIDAGLELYRQQMVEKELLKSTLRGSIKVLVDVLSLVNPDAFNRSERVKRRIVALGKRLRHPNPLKLELAGMLSQIGMIAVPGDVLAKRFKGAELTPEEAQIFHMHPSVATSLLSQIPRMYEVVEIIGSQIDCIIGPDRSKLSDEAVMLNLCLEYDDLEQLDLDKESIVQNLAKRWAALKPDIFKTFEDTIFSEEGYVPRLVPFKSVVNGMVLNQDIFDSHGTLIMPKGQEITESKRQKLSELRQGFTLPDALRVLTPIPPA